MKNETKSAVIYSRTATAEQDLEYQTKQCYEFAQEQGYTVKNVFTDSGKSGYDLKRQGLNDMLDYCTSPENEIDAVIVTRFDRLTRNFDDYDDVILPLLKEYNIKLLSATLPNVEITEDTPMMSLVLSFSAVEIKHFLKSREVNCQSN